MKGIYQIRNIIDDKIYIGSSIDIQRRWNDHINILKKGKHHSIRLQNAWNMYGENNFRFEVIETILLNEFLEEREQYWIDKTKSYCDNFGYNIAIYVKRPRKGKPAWNKGLTGIYTKEVLENMSKTRKGKKLSEEHKKNIKETCLNKHVNKGRKHTKKERERIGKNRKYGIPWNKGKKGLQIGWSKGLTKETHLGLKKISEARIKMGKSYHAT